MQLEDFTIQRGQPPEDAEHLETVRYHMYLTAMQVPSVGWVARVGYAPYRWQAWFRYTFMPAWCCRHDGTAHAWLLPMPPKLFFSVGFETLQELRVALGEYIATDYTRQMMKRHSETYEYATVLVRCFKTNDD
jgi:hypothetical protein